MNIQEIEVPRPLLDCFLCCEIHCVRECCGINAFSTDIGTIAEWGRDAGAKIAAEALSQIYEIFEAVADRERIVLLRFLNHGTCDEQVRKELLDFLAAYEHGLQMAANGETRDTI